MFRKWARSSAHATNKRSKRKTQSYSLGLSSLRAREQVTFTLYAAQRPVVLSLQQPAPPLQASELLLPSDEA
jgi:hypothetical protein